MVTTSFTEHNKKKKIKVEMEFADLCAYLYLTFLVPCCSLVLLKM